MCHDTEEWCKIFLKNDLLFQKCQEFGGFWPEYSKDSKISMGIFDGILKFTEELCVTTMKNDAKFEQETDLSFQNWHGKFDKFWPEHSRSTKELCLMALKIDAKLGIFSQNEK